MIREEVMAAITVDGVAYKAAGLALELTGRDVKAKVRLAQWSLLDY